MFRNDEGEERFEDIFDDRNNKSEPSLSQEKKFMTSDSSHRQSQKSVQEPKALSANAAMKPCLDDIAADLQISPKHEQR